jgi:hypothetical protein
MRPFFRVASLALVAPLGIYAGCVSSSSSPPAGAAADAGPGEGLDATVDVATTDAGGATPDQNAPADVAPSEAAASDAGVWQSGPALPVPRTNAFAAAPGNGYLYIADGYVNSAACNEGTSDGRVFFAKQNADGSLGAWTETAVGPSDFMRSIPGHAEANGFVYVAGGAVDSPAWNGDVWFAKPAADGTIPSWTQATQSIPTWIGSAPVMVANAGVLYVGAGFNAFTTPQDSSALFMATLDPTSGEPGAWTQLVDLPVAPSNGQLVVSGAGYAYFFQGASTQAYVASLAALVATADAGAGVDSGSIWQLSPNALPITPAAPSAFVVGSNLYVLPGGSPNLYVSALQADGSLGAWSVATAAPAPLSAGYQGISSNGFFYVLGEDNCGGTDAGLTATYEVPIP